MHKFDNHLIGLITEKNTKEHDVMSALFDFISNIKTVITLRFENRALATIKTRINAIFPVFKTYSILNERKRFSMDMITTITATTILGMYIFHEFSQT